MEEVDMKPCTRLTAALALTLVLGACATAPPVSVSPVEVAAATPAAVDLPELQVPVTYSRLDNGLKVVLSTDHTTPIATVAVYYGIGFRIEPRDRTGFAHLFEHMMFQGSENLGKMEFIKLIQANGGILNGSTRFDFTNYFQVVPAHTLETVLWAEADRMKGLAITQENLTNQQEVVKNEVRVNVLNRAYGGFPWLDLPQYANENWYNAHNFYGELDDLDAATLEDVQSFFDTYYAPNNAVVVVTGDIDVDQTRAWIERYFGGIAPAPQPPTPDVSEPRQTTEKRFSKHDALATRPALAIGYHAPDPGSPEYYALALIDQILSRGEDSRLHQELVQNRGFTGRISASLNYLGNMFNINGPTLYAIDLFHDAETPPDEIISVIDQQIVRLQQETIDQETLDRARIKMISSLFDSIEGFYGIGRADLLAVFALFHDDPAMINTITRRFEEITPELIRATAREYLRPTNRTVLTLIPGPAGEEVSS
jgi:zinc protease